MSINYKENIKVKIWARLTPKTQAKFFFLILLKYLHKHLRCKLFINYNKTELFKKMYS